MAAVALVEASAACVGSLISTSIMYPLEVTKTKVQAFGGRSKTATQDGSASEQTKAMNTMVGALRYTWKTEGYNGLFPPFAPGWIPKLVDAGTFNFIFWFWFTICTAISRRIGQGFWIDTVTGIVAAVINRLCTHPFENIAQRIQTRLPGQPLEGFFSAGGNICKETGIGGLWKGLPPALVLCINPSINMVVFFRIRGAYLRWASARVGRVVVDVAPVAAFFIAMAAKSIAALSCYPLTRCGGVATHWTLPLTVHLRAPFASLLPPVAR
jgi:adenine nucleotide transporter 17